MTTVTGSVEDTIVTLVHWLKLGVEILGAGLVALGVCVAMTHLIRTAVAPKPAEFTASRYRSSREWKCVPTRAECYQSSRGTLTRFTGRKNEARCGHIAVLSAHRVGTVLLPQRSASERCGFDHALTLRSSRWRRDHEQRLRKIHARMWGIRTRNV